MEFKEFILPRALVSDQDTKSDTFGRFFAEPFERGFGVTLGNSLRRVLLSGIQGAAVTAIQIEGVRHKFEDVQGVKEDVMRIMMNLRQIVFRMDPSKATTTIYLDIQGPGKVCAGDLQLNQHIEVL